MKDEEAQTVEKVPGTPSTHQPPSWEQKLLQRDACGTLRRLNYRQGLIDFTSNDYLGLARSQRLPLLVHEEYEKNLRPLGLNGWGATGSRLLTGHFPYTAEVEEEIATFHGFEAGLLFTCGYMANVGLLSAVVAKEDVVLYDAHSHVSTRDGIRLSGAEAFAFRHNDLNHLEEKLRQRTQRTFICVESLYAMDGSRAPLEALCALSARYCAHLIVDEAHAVGLIGPEGRGGVAESGLQSQLFAHVVCFGKALGTFGAMVLGNRWLKSYLLNFAHSCIYTTALPLQSVAAIRCAYRLLPTLQPERAHLMQLVRCFQEHLETPIKPWLLPGNDRVQKASQRLMEAGFDVRPLKSPTVRQGRETLRICLHAFNTLEEVARLKELLLCIESS